MDKIVFLDRDGTLCDLIHGTSCRRPRELTIWPETIRACRQLKDMNFKLVMVTNQPDIYRRLTTWEEVDEINDTIKRLCRLDAVEVCPHTHDFKCLCRKPNIGMILKYRFDPLHSYLIGDNLSDLKAASNAKIRGILIRPPSTMANAVEIIEILEKEKENDRS